MTEQEGTSLRHAWDVSREERDEWRVEHTDSLEGLSDMAIHRTFVDAITDETHVIPDPSKPGFKKDLTELAIERNSYHRRNERSGI